MDVVDLPIDVVKHMLLFSTTKDILSWCTTNSKLKTICKDESFWANKLSHDYPEYNGQLLYNSYRKTVKLLYRGKTIIVNTFLTFQLSRGFIPSSERDYKKFAARRNRIIVDANTTFNTFYSPGNNLIQIIVNGETYSVSITTASAYIRKSGEEVFAGDPDDYLDSVMLPGDQNLLVGLTTVNIYTKKLGENF